MAAKKKDNLTKLVRGKEKDFPCLKLCQKYCWDLGVGRNLQQQITGPDDDDDDDDDDDGGDNDDKDDDIIVVMSVMSLKGMELTPTKAEHITPPQSSIALKFPSKIPTPLISAFHLCLRLMLPRKYEA